MKSRAAIRRKIALLRYREMIDLAMALGVDPTDTDAMIDAYLALAG